ncbi:MAG: hypothetical protein AABY22_15020 [Nanoarchaeota archaeon]
MQTLTIGADIELFLYDRILKEYTSAIGIISGTKNNPTKITKDGFALQHDGLLCEFNIPPVTSEKGLIDNINFIIQHIKNIIPQIYDIHIVPSARFKDKYLTAESTEIGCDKDYNIYTKESNNVVRGEHDYNLFSCGGHIHIGFKNKTEKNHERIIKMMDLYLGIPSIILDNDRDRKRLYGNAGCYRIQPHGIEYRTLSNFWITSSSLTAWAFNSTLHAVYLALSGKEITPRDQYKIVDSINMGIKDNCIELIDKYKIQMPKMVIKSTKITA